MYIFAVYLFPGDVKDVSEKTHDSSYGPYHTVSEMRIKSHLGTQHTNSSPAPPLAHTPQITGPGVNATLACPLCQEPFAEKSTVQKHLTAVHNVNSEGLQKLLSLVEEPKSIMPPTTTPELPIPNAGSLKHARDIEVVLDVLELEYSKLAAEDGKLYHPMAFVNE